MNMEFAIQIVWLVIGLGFIIFVHELGHFLAARAVGIKVDQFAIGFGQAMASWRKGMGVRIGSSYGAFMRRITEHLAQTQGQPVDPAKLTPRQIARAADELQISETEYRLNWIPLGGYVKMLGQEDLDPSKLSDDPRAFNQKPVWARTIVISAGVIMNLIFGAAFFIVAFMIGVAFPPAEVGGVKPGSPAATTEATNAPGVVGLIPGDRIVSINGDAPADFSELKVATALSSPGQPIRVEVERPSDDAGQTEKLTFDFRPRKSDETELLELGIIMPSSTQLGLEEEGQTGAVSEHLEQFGLAPGMQLIAVDGQPISHHWQYVRALNRSGGQPLQVTFAGADGDTVETTIQPQSLPGLAEVPLNVGDGAEDQDVANLLGLVPPTRVEAVDPTMPAAEKLQAGDLIAAVDDVKWPTTAQVIAATQRAAEDYRGAEFVLYRDGRMVHETIAPRKPVLGLLGTPRIGIALGMAFDQPRIGQIIDGPFASTDLVPNSRLISINGQTVDDYRDIRLALQQANPAQAVPMVYEIPLAGGTEQQGQVALTDQQLAELNSYRWTDPIGLFGQLREDQQASNPIAAAQLGFDRTWLFLQQTYVMIARLIQGSVDTKAVSGPVGIAVVGAKFGERGFAYLCYFLGLLSVNLAVINFLPLPIVDGGLFVLLMIEKVRGKPVPVAVQSAITIAGLVLLGTIFIYVTLNDITRHFGG